MELVIYFKKKKEPRHPSDALFFCFTLIMVKNILQILVMIYKSVSTDPQKNPFGQYPLVKKSIYRCM